MNNLKLNFVNGAITIVTVAALAQIPILAASMV